MLVLILVGHLFAMMALVFAISDMIKGNESLVENFNFYFLPPLYHTFKILHFDANPIAIEYQRLVTEMMNLSMLKTI